MRTDTIEASDWLHSQTSNESHIPVGDFGWNSGAGTHMAVEGNTGYFFNLPKSWPIQGYVKILQPI